MKNKNTAKTNNKNKKGYPNFIIKTAVVFLLLAILFTVVFAFTGCYKNANSATEEAATAQSQQQNETATTVASSESKAPESVKDSTTTSTTAAATETTAPPTETTEAIPADISKLIKSADAYYGSGEYGLAKSTYRKAVIAIDSSSLSEDAKQELKDSFATKYNKSKDIIETATMHYANAMQLQYEQRYDEAKKELEAALAIYPKYGEAVEAYDNLKAVMGLE